MDECEVCGRKANELFLVEIEGAQMTVCRHCANGKETLKTFSDVEKMAPKAKRRAVETDEIVENYGRIIKAAREKMGIPAKVLAERISERESSILRVENEGGLPDDALAKKLEKALGITLITKTTVERQSYSASKQGPITMGDAAIIKKDKQHHEEQVD